MPASATTDGRGGPRPQADERTKPAPSAVSTGSGRVAAPTEVEDASAAVAMPPDLAAQRQRLASEDARGELDRLVARLGPERARKALAGMERSPQGVEGALIASRAARLASSRVAAPFGEAAHELPALRSAVDSLGAHLDQWASGNTTPGSREWVRRLRGEDEHLRRMESGQVEVLSSRITGLRNNIDGLRAEMDDARLQDASAVGVQRQYSGGRVEIDNVNKAGDTWSEVKNKAPFSTEADAWLDEVLPQARRLLAAAKEHGVPRVRYAFPRGVGADVAAALEAMGVQVDGARVVVSGREAR